MPFGYKPYEESEAVKQARANLERSQTYTQSDNVINARNALQAQEANKVADWTGGQYGESLKQALDKINNREKFSYDMNADMLYQQYKDRYMNQGRMAMMDTMGQAAQLTGGYGNSYAATAGNQAYQQYLTQLNDVVPQLYQMAYQQYQDEGQGLKDNLNIYQNLYNTEYGEYRDRVGDWQNEVNRLADRYYNEYNLDYNQFADNRKYYNDVYQTERNYDYNLYADAYDRALKEYQLALAEATAGGGGGGGGGGRSGSGGGGGSSSSGSSSSGSYIDQINKYVASSNVAAQKQNSYSKATSAVKQDYKAGTISKAEQDQALALLRLARKTGDLK